MGIKGTAKELEGGPASPLARGQQSADALAPDPLLYHRVADTYKGWLLEKRECAGDAFLTHLADRGENLSGYGMSDTDGQPPPPRCRGATQAKRITADARLATTDGTALAADLH